MLCACRPTMKYVSLFVLLKRATFVRCGCTWKISAWSTVNCGASARCWMSAHFEEQKLYFLALPPTVLIFSLATTCRAMQLWRRPMSPPILVLKVLTSSRRLRRNTWNSHEYACLLRRNVTIGAVPEMKDSSMLCVLSTHRACRQLLEVGDAKSGDRFFLFLRDEGASRRLLVLG